MKKSGLGKGLDALFEDNSFDIADSPAATARVADIEPDKDQPRRNFDEKSLAELAESIKLHGVISPLIVKALPDGRYRIIAGERRWRAARLAEVETVPIIVKEYTDSEISEISLVENLQRQDLNPLEEAFGYKKLMDNYGLTQEQVSQKVSKSRSAVANALRLIALPEQVLDYVRTGELSAGHARTLLSLENDDDIILAANKVISDELSVRQTEELIKRMKTPGKQIVMSDPDVERAIAELESRAANGTGNKVKIKHGTKNQGRIEIYYGSTDELEKIIDILDGGAGKC